MTPIHSNSDNDNDENSENSGNHDNNDTGSKSKNGSDPDTHHEANAGSPADPDADHMLPDTHVITHPSLERDCAGWTYIGQLGGALANWVDDPDDPFWGITVLTTGKQVSPDGEGKPKTQEDIWGVSRVVASKSVSGYTVDYGPSHGDGATTTETITERYGEPDQSPRDVEEAIYEDVLEDARTWLREHDPEAMRQRAINDGYVPNPLPEAEADTDVKQDGLDSFIDN